MTPKSNTCFCCCSYNVLLQLREKSSSPSSVVAQQIERVFYLTVAWWFYTRLIESEVLKCPPRPDTGPLLAPMSACMCMCIYVCVSVFVWWVGAHGGGGKNKAVVHNLKLPQFKCSYLTHYFKTNLLWAMSQNFVIKDTDGLYPHTHTQNP